MTITSAQIHHRLFRAGGWFEPERKSCEPKLESGVTERVSFDADRDSSRGERESFSGLPGSVRYSGKVSPLSSDLQLSSANFWVRQRWHGADKRRSVEPPPSSLQPQFCDDKARRPPPGALPRNHIIGCAPQGWKGLPTSDSFHRIHLRWRTNNRGNPRGTTKRGHHALQCDD